MTTSLPIHDTPGDNAGSRVERAREADRRWSTTLGLTLLVADPDASQQEGVLTELAAAGVKCAWCLDGAETLVQYGRLTPDAILLAPVLGVVDAPTVVRTIRERSALPILLGIGPGESMLAGPALVAGASTAVARPYDPAEVLRRLEAAIPYMPSRTRLKYGPLQLDPGSYTVRLNGVELNSFPLKEFELLRLLMTNGGRVVSNDQIRHALWGDNPHGPSPNAVVVHVARLRALLGQPDLLRTIRGRGYRLTFPATEENGAVPE